MSIQGGDTSLRCTEAFAASRPSRRGEAAVCLFLWGEMEAAIEERVEQFKALEAEEEREAREEGASVYEQMNELILDGCSIRSISSADAALLSKFTNLAKLGLNQTGLSSLANLPVMPSVRSLEATDNHLSCGLEKLAAAFPNLKKLQLGGNHLKTLEDVKPLVSSASTPLHFTSLHCTRRQRNAARADALRSLQAELKQLEHLGLDLNPVAALPEYREAVFGLVPSLQVLDSQDRSGKDCDAPDSDEEEEGASPLLSASGLLG